MLLCSVATAGQATAVTDHILADMRAPIVVEDTPLTARASIGIAVAGPGADDATELLHRADLAMYRAKGSAETHVRVYDVGPAVGILPAGRA